MSTASTWVRLDGQEALLTFFCLTSVLQVSAPDPQNIHLCMPGVWILSSTPSWLTSQQVRPTACVKLESSCWIGQVKFDVMCDAGCDPAPACAPLAQIEPDAAFARRWQPVAVEELGPGASLVALAGLAPRYEAHHGVSFTHAALAAAVRCAQRCGAVSWCPGIPCCAVLCCAVLCCAAVTSCERFRVTRDV
jgi:hypothetical protein